MAEQRTNIEFTASEVLTLIAVLERGMEDEMMMDDGYDPEDPFQEEMAKLLERLGDTMKQNHLWHE